MKFRNPDGTFPSIDARELARAEEQVKRALARGPRGATCCKF